MPINTPRKTTPWQVIATGKVAERVPRLSGFGYYALPFVLDLDADWDEALEGIDPRATLISKYPRDHATKADQIYPTNITVAEDKANFLGILIDGHNYEQDQNASIVLTGALELKYVQSDTSKPWGQIDAAVEAVLGELGITRIKDNIYWDTTRKQVK